MHTMPADTDITQQRQFDQHTPMAIAPTAVIPQEMHALICGTTMAINTKCHCNHISGGYLRYMRSLALAIPVDAQADCAMGCRWLRRCGDPLAKKECSRREAGASNSPPRLPRSAAAKQHPRLRTAQPASPAEPTKCFSGQARGRTDKEGSARSANPQQSWPRGA